MTNQTTETRHVRRSLLRQLAVLPLVGGTLALDNGPVAAKPAETPRAKGTKEPDGSRTTSTGGRPQSGVAARRTVLAGIAIAPAALLSRPALAIEPDLDDAVAAKAGEVRRLFLEAKELGARCDALRDVFDDLASDTIGARPHLNQADVDQACSAILESFKTTPPTGDDITVAGLEALRAERRRFAEAFALKQAQWRAGHEAFADRVGLTEATRRDEAAVAAAFNALDQLARMPIASPSGAMAKAAVFAPPLRFADEVHTEFALAVFQDLARCATRRAPAALSPFDACAAAKRAVVAIEDPLPAMWAEIYDLHLKCAPPSQLSEDEFERRYRRARAIDEQATTTRHATTIAGAIASLEWARHELIEFCIAGLDGDPGERLVLALIDGALRVLREGARTSSEDPIPAMWAEVRTIRAKTNLSKDELERGIRRVCALDERARTTKRARTTPGAIASLEWARAELVEFYIDGTNGDAGERLILALIDGALGVIRRAEA